MQNPMEKPVPIPPYITRYPTRCICTVCGCDVAQWLSYGNEFTPDAADPACCSDAWAAAIADMPPVPMVARRSAALAAAAVGIVGAIVGWLACRVITF